ncbi:STAS/SEC14 domain-containing protein [Kistimonas asteriae]|uniref:STAS/SEC14 domain-containing protein n=1 Tax=Kistimonas asteriae TaxID=517724 RepID=UPI001BACC3E8|nr:STAS/SEC14 domain-containing protein [Kistimonas asteriae]
MLELISIPIENAVAIRSAGSISEAEMAEVLAAAREKTTEYGNIVIYEEIERLGSIAPGAILEKIKYLFEVGISNIHKVAVLTDKPWIGKVVELEDKLFSQIELRCFALDDKAAALAFLMANNK